MVEGTICSMNHDADDFEMGPRSLEVACFACDFVLIDWCKLCFSGMDNIMVHFLSGSKHVNQAPTKLGCGVT